MKASAFDYVRAASVADALALLARHGDGAKLIAGGQSLLPALNLRLSAPAILIDIGRLPELRGVSLTPTATSAARAGSCRKASTFSAPSASAPT